MEAAAAAMVGLHATDNTTVYLSAWARVDALTRADVDQALYVDRTVVKQLAMRRTLFVFPRDLLAAAVSGAGTRVAEREATQLIREIERAGLHGDGEAWLAAASAAVLERLADGPEATWAQVRDSVPQLEGIQRVLAMLSARGEIARGPNAGSWLTSIPTWTLMRRWLGEPLAHVDPDAARAELVRRWLHSFGPGTEADLRWWLGDTATNVRAAVRTVGAVEVELDEGAIGYVLADDLEPVEPVEPWAALLPALDPTTMGWRDRRWYLDDHRAALFDSAGNGGTTAWWDGRIVGAWHQLHGPEVDVHLLEDIGREGVDALKQEAERLTVWLDGARPGARWPSPVLTALRGSAG